MSIDFEKGRPIDQSVAEGQRRSKVDDDIFALEIVLNHDFMHFRLKVFLQSLFFRELGGPDQMSLLNRKRRRGPRLRSGPRGGGGAEAR